MTAIAPIQSERSSSVIAISGGKGGVGKSTVALHLSVALSRSGRRTLLVDGDLSLANQDVLLGLTPSRTLEHLLSENLTLADIVQQGPDGLQVLPASSGIPDLASLTALERDRLLSQLEAGRTQVDHVVIDTGAGLGSTSLELQLAASRVILLATPEPTALVDAYATLKVLWTVQPDHPVDVVINAARSDDDAEQSYERLCRAAKQFLGREPGWLGSIPHDEAIPKAVRQQRSVFEIHPDSSAALHFESLARRVAAPHGATDATPFWNRLRQFDTKEVLHLSKERPMPWVPEVRAESSPIREKFVASHLGLVRSIVMRIGSRLPASVDLDDLYQEGVLGLMEATRRYEPSRGVPFASFAEQRVHGAVLDSLRKSDWQTRANRSKQRQLESTVARLGAKLRRQPTENEIAAGAGLSVDAYRELLQSLNAGPSLSLDQLEAENSEKHIACDDGVEQRLERDDQVRQVAEKLKSLPDRELQVLQLYYYSGLNMKEVGSVLGVTESRVCQLHAQATTRLRSAIAAQMQTRPVTQGRSR